MPLPECPTHHFLHDEHTTTCMLIMEGGTKGSFHYLEKPENAHHAIHYWTLHNTEDYSHHYTTTMILHHNPVTPTSPLLTVHNSKNWTGFQDTVVGLAGLAGLAGQLATSNPRVNLRLIYGVRGKNLQVTSGNTMLLQREEVSELHSECVTCNIT